MVDINRRQFIKLTLSAAAVAAVAPAFVAPVEAEVPELAKARDLRGSFDGGGSFFKLKGNIVARDLGDKIEFAGWINAPARCNGRDLSVQHPESGVWLPVEILSP